MATLEGAVICQSAFHSKFSSVSAQSVNVFSPKHKNQKPGLWGYKGIFEGALTSGVPPVRLVQRRIGLIHFAYRSSSDGNGSMAENFNENDAEYVNSSVIEAVEVRSGLDGFFIKMRDGRNLRCVHNSPQGGHLPDYAPHPAIVLKMEDGSGVLLPIIVLEMPNILLMAALRNIPFARPTIYQVVGEMIDKMGYAVQLVRVTKRVHEAYFAELYVSKVGNSKEIISFDLRPSDAINMAIRCKVPIQVNRTLAYNDGMKVIEPVMQALKSSQYEGLLTAELDRPDGQPCMETEEFDLIRNMLIAAVEERYRDAAQWRDKLFQLRSKKRNWT
ncbi:Bifunctional nuclease 1 [Apostasia shenzhenica]|uniref:Bifunctional nuclease 1 n=1 Tax=Apostasia shenzhenica TaxID=1088818 RepID=A0A2I0BBY7_9ASPA|nr:Bifunctional nuclease 1 [Apostasia shenzhenica]